MPKTAIIKQNSQYTFKYNTTLGRHGWLRLTPAYSVRLVNDILSVHKGRDLLVLDPFSGTGTTGIVAGQNGYDALLCDINPFLVWFAKAKAHNYTFAEVESARVTVADIISRMNAFIGKKNWTPNIFNIQRWWNTQTLNILAALHASIAETIGEPQTSNEFSLIWIAFCRLVIETSSAAFNHVSMSFNSETKEYDQTNIVSIFDNIATTILNSAEGKISGNISVVNIDSRLLEGLSNIDLVITSPPYPNRISYIRELRPYMYWLKFITTSCDSGDIDWESIGGTWGSATSKLLTWNPTTDVNSNLLKRTVKTIAGTAEKNSRLMSIYVHKYFYDMYEHTKRLYSILNKNAQVYYIVGNSYFFNVPVDSAVLFQEMFEANGFSNVQSRIIRKRNCKKALYEYCISAIKR
jgi:DNA modification methylase